MDFGVGDVWKRRAEIHDMRERGLEPEVIAQKTGLSQRYVTRYLRMAKPKLVPIPRSQAWRDDAACAGMDDDTFFPSSRGTGGRAQAEAAARICAACPVKRNCHETALYHGIQHGVWGGENFANYRYALDEETGAVVWWARGDRGSLTKVG